MKEFSLEEYLKNPNREVVTRKGEPVRIICTDRPTEPSIVALVTEEGRYSAIRSYFTNGQYIKNEKCNLDLVFTSIKYIDYINLYHNKNGYYMGSAVFNSEEKAQGVAIGDEDYITTIKIERED